MSGTHHGTLPVHKYVHSCARTVSLDAFSQDIEKGRLHMLSTIKVPDGSPSTHRRSPPSSGSSGTYMVGSFQKGPALRKGTSSVEFATVTLQLQVCSDLCPPVECCPGPDACFFPSLLCFPFQWQGSSPLGPHGVRRLLQNPRAAAPNHKFWTSSSKELSKEWQHVSYHPHLISGGKNYPNHISSTGLSIPFLNPPHPHIFQPAAPQHPLKIQHHPRIFLCISPKQIYRSTPRALG